MQLQRISSLFVVILFACCVLAKEDPNKEVVTILNCVAKSGDQKECDEILHCNDKLAQPYQDAYNECVKLYLPNGIGSCDENSELYYSEEIRRQIYGCIQYKVANAQLTDEQEQQMDNFQECVHTLGEKAGCKTED
ncbi:hypothetical protein AVEN_183414-1 [Araneus ventricosus]|uniref:DUF19 domain-containing protein n=1 Tax=Araneus ventricosus TaxID=182803 RepID=A0A4Y2K5N8_ARAVE|nr:hypothetical protein AVEN_183414-1 [Araneus ventricosus]